MPLTSTYKYKFLKLIGTILPPKVSAQLLGVSIGTKSRFFTRQIGNEGYLIKIGDWCTVTGGVRFITHDGSGSIFSDVGERKYKYAPITVGNNVFIGANSIVLPGVTIVDNVIIGAGSVVNKDILESGVWAGNPAKFLKSIDAYRKDVDTHWMSEAEAAQFLRTHS